MRQVPDLHEGVQQICAPVEGSTRRHRYEDLSGPRGSPSGRISGVAEVTPSELGFGASVTATWGEPTTPVRSWIRISMAKSLCTALLLWLT
jgi:hypothetical protein